MAVVLTLIKDITLCNYILFPLTQRILKKYGLIDCHRVNCPHCRDEDCSTRLFPDHMFAGTGVEQTSAGGD